MSDQSGMSALTEKGALDLAIATLQSRVNDRDAEIERLRAALREIAAVDFKRTAEQAADHFQTVARAALAGTDA